MARRQAAGEADAGAQADLTAEAILGGAEIAVIAVGQEDLIRYANPFAASLFGFADARQLRGVSLRDLGFEEDDLSKLDNLRRQVARGRYWEGTMSIWRADDDAVFLRASAVPMRDRAGRVNGTVITIRQAARLGAGAVAERVGLLDRIGERLSVSLELDVTLRRVAEILIPQFADHCFIDLRQGEMLIRKVQVSAQGWEPPTGGWAAVGAPITYPEGHFCARAMKHNEVVLVEDLMEENEYPAPTEQSMEASRNVGIQSIISAPLSARGQQLGVMTVALSNLTERNIQRYVIDDRDLMAAIASRVAVAIDNSMLFEEERSTALAFQNSLLPGRPPVLDGLEVAYRYVPAMPLETHGQGIQTQVGGDWYDIIQLSAGRVGIVIGDVEGRGATAAAVMGQLRSALRAFAQEDRTPSEILHRLDAWVGKMADEGADAPIVSCTYLIYDPWFRRLTFANAGHLAPLVVIDGHVRHMAVRYPGVLLGVRGSAVGMPTYREETRTLPAGCTLILYTDGLVDRRHRADGPGHYEDAEVQDMLFTAVRSAAHESVEKVAAAAESAVPGTIDDDMAIVVIRTSTEELQTWDVRLPAEPIRVSEARRVAYDTFIRCGMDAEQADIACLLVSEVATNAVLHTYAISPPRHDAEFDPAELAPGLASDWLDSPFSAQETKPVQNPEFMLRIRKGTTSVWIEVFDSDLRLPRIRVAGENDEGGRGLYLVDQLAIQWGARPTEDGKAVWFEMPLRSALTRR